jgi:hypothetical protein
MHGKRKGSVLNVMCRYIFMGNAKAFIIGQKNSVRILSHLVARRTFFLP